jgi:exodeoxyribonuclease V alpha subunit
MNLDPTQQAAITRATSSPFSIVTGGAGVGKTTIIKAITDTLESRGETVALCAFAGKAAARLREASFQVRLFELKFLTYSACLFSLQCMQIQFFVPSLPSCPSTS